MSVPITSSLLTSTTGYPIPTAFAAGTPQRISVVNGPAYVTLESRKQSKAIADRVAKINKDFNEKTAFKTSSGFLKDKYGNIVRSKILCLWI